MAQTEPIRLTILKRLTAHLETITKASGFNFDLNGKVFRGRKIFGKETPPPYLSILESPSSDLGILAGENNIASATSWRVYLQGCVVDDKDEPLDLAYYLADAVRIKLAEIRAVDDDGSGRTQHSDVYMLGGLLSSIDIFPAICRPPEENVSAYAHFYMPINLGIAQIEGR